MKTNLGALGLPTAALILGFAGCGEPDLKTALRPGGPPEVLAMVVRDTSYWFGATYCKANDGAVPDESCAYILNDEGGYDYYAEALAEVPQFIVVFDELLDPAIETLTQVAGESTADPADDVFQGSLADTQPFEITCGPGNTPIAYDGFYVPNGNKFTFPPGPALVIEPLDVLPGGELCSVTIKPGVVKDKDGEEVPADQLGPYEIPIEGLAFVDFDPAREDPDENDVVPPTEVTPDTAFAMIFNNYIDIASLDPSDGSFVDSTMTPVDVTPSVDGTYVMLTPNAPLTVGETYTLTLNAGATIADLAGGMTTIEEAQVLQVTVVADE